MPLSTLQSFAIDDSIRTRIPNTSLGLVLASVSVMPSSDELLKQIEHVSRTTRAKISADNLSSVDELAAARTAYRMLGKDPSRYRGSSEALVRRIISGKSLYKINNVVEVNNLISLMCLHPVGSYDADRIMGQVNFRLGTRAESYKGIGKETINTEDLPVFADELGAFGSPTSDSERAMIRPSTATVINVIISFTGSVQLEAHIKTACSLLKDHTFATIVETRICE